LAITVLVACAVIISRASGGMLPAVRTLIRLQIVETGDIALHLVGGNLDGFH
jgi:hypothetical protein